MFTCYEPRPTSFLGVKSAGGFRLKTYSICLRGAVFVRARFDRVWSLAEQALPQQASCADRPGHPGVGFAILHQGATGDYFVLCWWDHENELPTRVFVREGDSWRAARDGESFCVWDLEIMWHEREAYVRSMLTRGAPGIEGYLRDAAQEVR